MDPSLSLGDADDYHTAIGAMSESDRAEEHEHFTRTDHASRTMSKLTSYLRQHYLCDVIFICGHGPAQQRIPAHRLIMATLSDYFRTMFEINMIEAKQREVVIKDVDPEAFEKLVLYAYEGRAIIKFSRLARIADRSLE